MKKVDTVKALIQGVIAGNRMAEIALVDRCLPFFVRSCASRANRLWQDVEDASYEALSDFWLMLCKDDYAKLRSLTVVDDAAFDRYVSASAAGLVKNLIGESEKLTERCRQMNDEEPDAETDAHVVDWTECRSMAEELVDQLPPCQKKVMAALLANVEKEKPLPQLKVAEQCCMNVNQFNHNKALAMKNLKSMAAEMGCEMPLMAA